MSWEETSKLWLAKLTMLNPALGKGDCHGKAPRKPLLLLMVTVYRDHDRIFAALQAGACGYLLKPSTPDEIR